MDNNLELVETTGNATNSLVEATDQVANSLLEVTGKFTSSVEVTETQTQTVTRSEEVSGNVTTSSVQFVQTSEQVTTTRKSSTAEVPDKILEKVPEKVPEKAPEKVTCATVIQLHDIVTKNWSCPQDNLNEVYPGIFIGDEIAAKDTDLLKRLKMTHILNAAWSESASFIYVNTSQGYYTLRNCDCTFFGVRAVDSPTFKLARHFEESSDFIASALSNPSGRILVHCRQGVSRSATLVIVYLMQRKNMTAKEAVSLIRKKRNIFPNQGFMKEICSLDESLIQSRNSE